MFRHVWKIESTLESLQEARLSGLSWIIPVLEITHPFLRIETREDAF